MTPAGRCRRGFHDEQSFERSAVRYLADQFELQLYEPTATNLGTYGSTGRRLDWILLLPAYLAGIDLILQSDISEPQMLVALVFYFTLYVLSLAALMALRAVLGPRSTELLISAIRIVSTWVPRVIAVLLLILGVLMITDGVAYFFGNPLFPTGPAR